jgi:hypothetical protein
MLRIVLEQRRWLVVFALTLGLLLGIAMGSKLMLPSYRTPPFDFRAMKPEQLFVVRGLTRRQEGSIKVGFAETYAQPQIGLFGNHCFQYFGTEAFGRAADLGYFFNYWYANLALPEIYYYLRHLEIRGRLPSALILVQITTPNNDNGAYIINFGNELPRDLLLDGSEDGGVLQKAAWFAAIVWQVVENWLHELLNYNTFILGFLQGGPQDRVIDPAACRAAERPAWLRRMPLMLGDMIDLYAGHLYCQRRTWHAALRRDGSYDAAYADEPLIEDENPLRASERRLNAGDEDRIAGQMRAIDAIGRRHDIKVVFVVPPVYESDRDDSIVNQIFNRALARVPDLTVIDHRGLRRERSLFMNYNHQSPAYFRMLVNELRRRGLVQG